MFHNTRSNSTIVFLKNRFLERARHDASLQKRHPLHDSDPSHVAQVTRFDLRVPLADSQDRFKKREILTQPVSWGDWSSFVPA